MLTLKQFRKKYKLTQKELAEIVGITPTTLSKYENGLWTINQTVIDKIQVLYGEQIRAVKPKSKKRVWTPKAGKYRKMIKEFREDEADENLAEKFILEEMEHDEFERERGTTDLNAFRIWQDWPEERRQLYLHNAFCPNCQVTSFAKGFNIRQDAYGLIVEGNCEKCGHRIARCCD